MWHDLFHPVYDPRLSPDPGHLVDGQEGAEHVVLVLRVEHDLELVEEVVVAVLLILRQVLLQLLRGLGLGLPLLEVGDDSNQFDVLESDRAVRPGRPAYQRPRRVGGPEKSRGSKQGLALPLARRIKAVDAVVATIACRVQASIEWILRLTVYLVHLYLFVMSIIITFVL